MQVESIHMDPRIARIHYQDYHKKVLEHRAEREAELKERAHEAGKALGRIHIEKTQMEREDEVLMKAYKELSLGQRIIDLRSVMKNAGVDKTQYLPKLAIAKADAREGVFSHSWSQRWGNGCGFYDDTVDAWRSNTARSRFVILPRETFPAETYNIEWRQQNKLMGYTVRTVVPSVPPYLRPTDLNEFYILWEVEKWERGSPSVSPKDPFLLKRVSNHFFTVVAQWDLTPLEQKVLEGSL